MCREDHRASSARILNSLPLPTFSRTSGSSCTWVVILRTNSSTSVLAASVRLSAMDRPFRNREKILIPRFQRVSVDCAAETSQKTTKLAKKPSSS